MSEVFTYAIETPDKTVTQGQCEFLVVPTARGEVGIYAHHATLIVPVVPGEVRVTRTDRLEKVRVGRGMLHVKDNIVNILIRAES